MATNQTVTLIFKPRQGAVGALTIENTLSETYSFSSTPTKFPIEDGSIVSDHIITEPEKIKITGYISNTPLDDDLDPDNYAQEAFDQLYAMWQGKELVDVDTKYIVYSDMCITSISIPRTAQTGQAIQFDIELQKIKKVNSSSVNADKFQPDFLDKAPIIKAFGDMAAHAIDAIPNFVISQKNKDRLKALPATIIDYLNRGGVTHL